MLNNFGRDYKAYNTPVITAVPALLGDGYQGMLSHEIMQRKIEVACKPASDVSNAWWDYARLVSSTAAIANEKADLKIVSFNSVDFLKMINPEEDNCNEELRISDTLYDSLDGYGFCDRELEKMPSSCITPSQAKKHPLWIALANGDKSLLNEYVNVSTYLMKLNGQGKEGFFIRQPDYPVQFDKMNYLSFWTFEVLSIYNGIEARNRLTSKLENLLFIAKTK